MTSPVLITGGGGQLASDLALLWADVDVHAPSHAELDITDEGSVDRLFRAVGPALVVNCAAFHNVEVCEREEDMAFSVNAVAVKRLAHHSAVAGARFVHLSTNYVFDGAAEVPYTEDDRPSPRSVYAVSKLAGEYAALAYSPEALVVRTAGLYGRHGSASKGGNFVTRMVDRARRGDPLRVVHDQRLSPTFTRHLALAIDEAVRQRATGVVHLTSGGSCSWYEFTVAIVERAGVDTPVEPTSTDRTSGADRPANGVLARLRADQLGLTPLPHWRDGLAEYMAEAERGLGG